MAEFVNIPADLSWDQPDNGLMWMGHGRFETWLDARYWYDCRERLGSPHVVVQLTLEGAAFYEDHRGRRLVRPGQAFMSSIPGPFTYGYAEEVGGTYKLIYVAMVGHQAHWWCQQITQQFGNILDLGLDSPAHRMMVTFVRQPRSSRLRPDRYIHSAQVYQLFMTILSQLSQSRLDRTPHIGDAMALIEQQAMDPSFNVQELARQLGFSREYLTRQFRHVRGMSPLEAIIRRRLDMACQLLSQPHAKLETVARNCGFTSANYFCRQFRRRFGVSPGQYRQQPHMVLPARLSHD